MHDQVIGNVFGYEHAATARIVTCYQIRTLRAHVSPNNFGMEDLVSMLGIRNGNKKAKDVDRPGLGLSSVYL